MTPTYIVFVGNSTKVVLIASSPAIIRLAFRPFGLISMNIHSWKRNDKQTVRETRATRQPVWDSDRAASVSVMFWLGNLSRMQDTFSQRT